MGRKKASKRRAQRAHAKRRAWERYGIVLHQDLQSRLVKLIQSGKGEFIDRQSTRVSRWWVEVDGQRLPVVYDTIRKVIVTVLKEEHITRPCASRTVGIPPEGDPHTKPSARLSSKN